MTTNRISVISTPNVFQDNTAFNLPNSFENNNSFPQCSGVVLLNTSQSRDASFNILLNYFFETVQKRILSCNIWVLSGHSAWQPDNRITRYRKFWGMLKAKGIAEPDPTCSLESSLKLGGKIKYFGAKKLCGIPLQFLTALFKINRTCTYLLILPKQVTPDELINNGWCPTHSFDENILRFSLLNKGVVIKAFGEFDDLESSLVAIGDQEVVEILSTR